MTTTYYRNMDVYATLDQIGRDNVLAVSGGKWGPTEDRQGISFPVHYGYSVEVRLNGMDLYEVRRVFRRDGKAWIKGQVTNVFNTELGAVVYRASCYREEWGK